MLLPVFVKAQFTNKAVSDSINAGIVALHDTLNFDTTIQTYQVFYDSTEILYIYLNQIAGKQFISIRADDATLPTGGFDVHLFYEPGIIRSWHQYEIDTWVLGAVGTNWEGYTCSTVGPNRECTMTVSGDTWTGTAGNDENALGLAFYHFLIDPDFATYLQ